MHKFMQNDGFAIDYDCKLTYTEDRLKDVLQFGHDPIIRQVTRTQNNRLWIQVYPEHGNLGVKLIKFMAKCVQNLKNHLAFPDWAHLSQADFKYDYQGSFVSHDPENDFVHFEKCINKSSKLISKSLKLGGSASDKCVL